MAFVSPTDDIPVQEGAGWFSMTAGAAVLAGQCLIVDGTFECIVGTHDTDAFVGVAAYKKADGAKLMVYGPGNIVRCIASGTSKCVVGDDIFVAYQGRVSNVGTAANKIGVALETQATNNGTVRVMLT